jgi:16S rRNA (guanine527-N7)-methyltransferase
MPRVSMQIIEKYFPHLTSVQIEQFSQLGPLYNFWNEKINVISRKDIGNLYERHVLHSLSISRIISFLSGTSIIDAGTGGGFPGIPMAILFPAAHFILVDSIAKKTRVAETISREIGLSNCEIRNIRVEEMKDKADFVLCRAVTTIPKLYSWVKKNIIPGGIHGLPNGLLVLKGGDLEGELAPMGSSAEVYNLSDYFPEEYFQSKKLVYVQR